MNEKRDKLPGAWHLTRPRPIPVANLPSWLLGLIFQISVILYAVTMRTRMKDVFFIWLMVSCEVSRVKVRVRWVKLQECNDDTLAISLIVTCHNMLDTFFPQLHSMSHYFLLFQEHAQQTCPFWQIKKWFVYVYMRTWEWVCSFWSVLYYSEFSLQKLTFWGVSEDRGTLDSIAIYSP